MSLIIIGTMGFFAIVVASAITVMDQEENELPYWM